MRKPHGSHPDAECQHFCDEPPALDSVRSRLGGRIELRQHEHRGLCEIGYGRFTGRAKFARASQQHTIVEQLVCVVYPSEGCHSKLIAWLCRYGYLNAIPRPAPVPRVAFHCPSRNVSRIPGKRVHRTLSWCQVHCLPFRVVIAGLGPKGRLGHWIYRRVADLELPRPVQRDQGLAKRDGRCSGLRRRRPRGKRRLSQCNHADCSNRREKERGAKSSRHCMTSWSAERTF
jgi:hypothetical protein